ncbi:signal recognition particle-docking protein FtsY [Boudabousia marimammalium]|uniref:Signal recognition particle receptor FtsY n=2 Tax=Boudabousia marimammalium TaxID=156892 RepID=A0A1Q5PS05_9ACTO|nr:signal recognition particle-docking protein FtsY [Boudabousia marimammalium]
MPEVWGPAVAVVVAIAGWFGYKSSRDTASEADSGEAQLAASPSSESDSGQTAQPQGLQDAPEFEQPESVSSRMTRLRARLASSGALGKALLSVFARGDLKASDWEDIEDTLLSADLGLEATDQIMEALRTEVKVSGNNDSERIREVLRQELLKLVDLNADRELHLEPGEAEDGQKQAAAALVVGVNGVGKTTSVGKLARILVAEGNQVVLGAADTFRAAAADQLQTWGERVGVEVVRSDKEGADPASVAFDAVKHGLETQADVVLVDTAGRLHTKGALMDELGKIRRVMERGTQIKETLLVLDATTGQNGMAQAKVFAEVTNVTGIILTKLDGSAKGGIVVSVQKALGVPVKLVGLGEGADDMAPFDPESFVDSIIA